MKFRIYIDESGNADLGASYDPNHRYLSLTGVIISLDYTEKIIYPDLEQLKNYFFHSHPDEPIIFHRKELVNKREPFEALRNPETEKKFNMTLLELLSKWDYQVVTVTIDKLHHFEQYKTWRHDPYHYCLEVLTERFVLWLEANQAVGDIMIESRGGKEDLRLKKSYHRIWENRSDFISADRFQKVLTSSQLKVKAKSNNIAGLQIADLLAHPAFKFAWSKYEGKKLSLNFGSQIALILEQEKFYRNPSGKIEGWGMKWLP